MADRHLLLLLQYDGTAYSGWQYQLDVPTVQAALEAAILKLTGETIRAMASSRLDAGVHARGLPVAFWTDSTIPIHGFERGLNAYLPRDVAVLEVVELSTEFSVRRAAQGKIYRYYIWNGPTRAPLLDGRSWFVRTPLDAPAMARAGAALVGEHDFSAYRASNCQAKHPIRRLERVTVTTAEADDRRVTITVAGNAFLQHMIRIIAGTLVEVGRGREAESFAADALESRDRTRAGPTAPALGLLLDRVLYDPDPFTRSGPR